MCIRDRRKILVLILAVLVVAVAGFAILYQAKQSPIKLNGDAEMTISLNGVYDEPGATAKICLLYTSCSHGYGITVDVEPEHLMEKVLYATDELTGLIGAAALMRPSKSVQDMEVKSVKKKYKSANFAAGCSREVIERGADMLGWELSDLIQKTILAMRSCEADIAEAMAEEGN